MKIELDHRTLLAPWPDKEIVDDATRRQFLAMLGGAGLLVACGDGGGEAAGGGGGGSITVRHAGGETVFDEVPRRVVILDDAMLGDVLAFGVVPVGTAAGSSDPTVIDIWREDAGVDEIALVAPDFAPNLEAPARVRPDAIFAMGFQVDEAYWGDLQAIAPTIAVETDVNSAALDTRFDEVAMRTYAEVFQSPAVVDDVITEYEDRVRLIRAEFADVIDGRTISIADSSDGATIRCDVAALWAGAILADLGFAFLDVQRPTTSNPSSRSRLVLLRGDRTVPRRKRHHRLDDPRPRRRRGRERFSRIGHRREPAPRSAACRTSRPCLHDRQQHLVPPLGARPPRARPARAGSASQVARVIGVDAGAFRDRVVVDARPSVRRADRCCRCRGQGRRCADDDRG